MSRHPNLPRADLMEPETSVSAIANHVDRASDPWALVWGQPYIAAPHLARAIETDLLKNPDPDFRTRLLIRDAGRAIKSFWGRERFAHWLKGSSVGDKIDALLREDLGRPGFRNIRRRLVENVNQTELQQVLDLLGRAVKNDVVVDIAGSIPTLLANLTARPTDDIDIVNEIPLEIRRQRAVLRTIKAEFGLSFGHVASHYLPANWEERKHLLGAFGGLRVYLVDCYDIFVSKLSSKQEKHKQDIRIMAKGLDKGIAKERLLSNGQGFLREATLRRQIEENWRFIFQEPLGLPPIGGDPRRKKPARSPAEKPNNKPRKRRDPPEL